MHSRLHHHLLGFILGLFLLSLAPGQGFGQCAGYKISAPDACTCDDPSGRTAVRIVVKGAPGETWTVKHIIGLYDQMSPPPPAAPALISTGTQLFPTGLDSFYLDALRLNNNGYWIQVTNGTCDLDIMVGNSDPCAKNLLPVSIDPDGTPGSGDEYTLYVHPTDNSTSIEWHDLGDPPVGSPFNIPGLPDINDETVALADFNGEANTQAIVDAIGDNGGRPYAAKLCADLVYNGCDDWYLPSIGELNAMHQQLGVGGNANMRFTYWSSTEGRGIVYVWLYTFFKGEPEIDLKYTVQYRCRCVRK